LKFSSLSKLLPLTGQDDIKLHTKQKSISKLVIYDIKSMLEYYDVKLHKGIRKGRIQG